MLPLKRLSFRLRTRAFPAIAMLMVAGSGLGAGGSEAAAGPDGEPSAQAAAAALVAGGCKEGAPEAEPFVVKKANGGTRTILLCGSGTDHDRSATARALGAAIDAEGEGSRIYADARMPDLLSLRLMRSRTHVDPSLTPDERLRRLSAIEERIDALELAVSNSAGPQSITQGSPHNQ